MRYFIKPPGKLWRLTTGSHYRATLGHMTRNPGDFEGWKLAAVQK
jgi:hypothetical protein